MKSKKATKRALLSSALSLVLCFSMLLGTTFAWFTDEAKTGVNTIVSGTLDIQLLDAEGKNSIEGESLKFVKMQEDNTTAAADGVLWEPGATYYTQGFQIKNNGNLYLKFQMVVNGITNGDAKLLEAIDFYVTSDVNTAMTEWTKLSDFTSEEYKLAPKYFYTVDATEGTAEGSTLYLVGHMKEDAGNDYQDLTIDGVGITVYATQVEAEFDSFDNKYDVNATYEPWAGDVASLEEFVSTYDATEQAFMVSTGAQLARFAEIVNSGNEFNVSYENPVVTMALAEEETSNMVTETVPASFKGYTVKLADNIDLNNIFWTPIGAGDNRFSGTFIGTDYTISNLRVVGEKALGLFGKAFGGAHIEGVTIENAYVSGKDYVGAVLGQGYLSIANCTVTDATIISTPYFDADKNTYDGGAKAGVIAGQVYNGDITGCTATNSTVTAYRDLGGIAGMLAFDGKAGEVNASGNAVDEITLTYIGVDGTYDGETPNQNMGAIVGRVGKDAVVADDNTIGKVTEKTVFSYTIDGVVYHKDVATGEMTLFAITEAAPAVLNIPEGVTKLGSKILQGNTTVKKVVIPSTVKDFGGTPNADGTGASGGMFYKSAVEEVVLPAGLTEIPAAAFNQASELSSVNIPASVEKIGINAFAGTGLETLTVPATVKEIGYGAFRDMDNLTTVTIEGSVYIPTYAFRDSKALKAVYLNGEDVTFGTGMIFTVTETNNEDPNGITVYVANMTVKERLAATDYKGNIAVMVDSADELKAALTAGEKKIVITDTITLTESLGATDVTFTGVGENAGINFNGYNIGGSNSVTYKNLNLSTISLPQSPENGERYGWYGGIDYNGHSVANYEDCTITGVFTTYSNTVNATRCTFNSYVQDGEEFYNIFLYSSGTVNATDCTFMYRDRAIKIYSEGANTYELTIKGGKFVATDDYSVNKALINVDSTYFTSAKINIVNVEIDSKLESVALHNADGNSKVTVSNQQS